MDRAAYGSGHPSMTQRLLRTFRMAAAMAVSVGLAAGRVEAAEASPIVKVVEVEAGGVKGGVCNEKGEPWEDVVVSFKGADGKDQQIRQAVTGSDGVFIIDLPNTTCTLRIDRADLKINDTQLSRCDGLRV